MEEEDKLEVLGNLLEFWTKRGDGDKLGDVEDDRKYDHWHNVLQGQHFVCLFTGLLLRKKKSLRELYDLPTLVSRITK